MIRLLLIIVLLRNSLSQSAPESDQVLQINRRPPHQILKINPSLPDQVVQINPSIPRVTFQIAPSEQTLHGNLFGNIKNKEYLLEHGQIVIESSEIKDFGPQVQKVRYQNLPNLDPNYKWIKIESDADRHHEFKQPSDIAKIFNLSQSPNSNSEGNQNFEKHFEIHKSSESSPGNEKGQINTVTHDQGPENRILLQSQIRNTQSIPLSTEVVRLTIEGGQQNYPTNFLYGNRKRIEPGQQLHQGKDNFDGPVFLISQQPHNAVKLNSMAKTSQDLLRNREGINFMHYVPERSDVALENAQKKKKVPVVSSSFDGPVRSSSQQEFMDLQSVLESLLYAVGGPENLNRSHFSFENFMKTDRNGTQQGMKEFENRPQNDFKMQFGNIKPFAVNSQDFTNTQSTVDQSQSVNENIQILTNSQPIAKNTQDSVDTLQSMDSANRTVRIKTSAADLYITRKPCEICCKEGEREPCRTCCYVTPLLNASTLKTAVG